MTDLQPFPDQGPQAVECADGQFLVTPDGKVIEQLSHVCPMCGRFVDGYFDHIALDCKEMDDDEIEAAVEEE